MRRPGQDVGTVSSNNPSRHEETKVTETPTARSVTPDRSSAPAPTAWVGWLVYAGIMMILVGSFQAIDGLIALFNDNFYVVRPNGLVVNLDYTAWGWTHLLLGILLIAAGSAVFSGRIWGRTLGVIAAMLSAIVNFAFIPAYPVWSLLIITVDVLVIYALIAHGGELRDRRGGSQY
jgi:hypothetical protein